MRTQLQVEILFAFQCWKLTERGYFKYATWG